MCVEVEPDIEISAKTVGELRSVTIWRENLAILTPQERHPESAVRVGKANVVARTSPKSQTIFSRTALNATSSFILPKVW
jgi:hypothetical protein